MTKFYTPLQLV